MSSELATIIGGVLEVVGLGLVAVKLWLIQRAELGIPPGVYRLLRFLHLARPKSVEASASMTATASLTARWKVQRQRATTVDERLDRLDAEVVMLEGVVEDTRKALEQKIADVRSHLDGVHGQRQREDADREHRRRTLLRHTQRLEVTGWVCFVAGVGFSVGGGLS